MPKVEGPLFSMSAHGTMKDVITFEDGPSGSRVQKVPRHRDMKTAAQLLHRTSFTSAVSSWNALDPASKAYYETLAQGQGMTGYNLYVRLFLLGEGVEPSWHYYEVDVRVSASADDASPYWDGGQWYWGDSLTNVNHSFGYYGPSVCKMGGGVRFLNITIPDGATIDVAYLKFTASASKSETVINTKIIGNKDLNAAAFSNLADYQARRGTSIGGPNNNRRTVAEVLWDGIPAWTEDVEYQSPSIVSVIQEIIDQDGWASGNALALFHDDHDARGSQSFDVFKNAYSWDGSAEKAVFLHIEASKFF